MTCPYSGLFQVAKNVWKIMFFEHRVQKATSKYRFLKMLKECGNEFGWVYEIFGENLEHFFFFIFLFFLFRFWWVFFFQEFTFFSKFFENIQKIYIYTIWTLRQKKYIYIYTCICIFILFFMWLAKSHIKIEEICISTRPGQTDLTEPGDQMVPHICTPAGAPDPAVFRAIPTTEPGIGKPAANN